MLDVGTFEGFWAFEMERRGAEVVALDIDDDPGARLAAAPAARGRRAPRRGLRARPRGARQQGRAGRDADLQRHARGARRQFDLVFCGSVMIHLRDPMLALERLAALCRAASSSPTSTARARLAWFFRSRAGRVPRREPLDDLVAAGEPHLGGDGPLRRLRGGRDPRAVQDGLPRSAAPSRTSSSTPRRRERERRRSRARSARACAAACSSCRAELNYGCGPLLASRLRKWWVLLRHPHADIRFTEPVYLGPGLQPLHPRGGILPRRPGGRVPARLPGRAGPGAEITIGAGTRFTYDVGDPVRRADRDRRALHGRPEHAARRRQPPLPRPRRADARPGLRLRPIVDRGRTPWPDDQVHGHRARIGERAFVGANAVVTSDIPRLLGGRRGARRGRRQLRPGRRRPDEG